MYYQDEIRQVDEFRTDTSLVKEKELALAKILIESLAAEFEPEKYHDTYRDNLYKMIEAKIEGHKVVETPDGAYRAGDRHHGGAEEEPGRKAEARTGSDRSDRHQSGRDGAEEEAAEEQGRIEPLGFENLFCIDAPSGVSSCLNIR